MELTNRLKLNTMSECLQKKRVLWFDYVERVEAPDLVHVESSRLVVVYLEDALGKHGVK